MPCKEAKARKLLRDGKAKAIRRTPFTIKLLWDCEDNIQEVIAGMDTGSKTIGCAAISNGKVVYQAEVENRNDITKKMTQRKMYRRIRRNKKVRYRKSRWQNKSSLKKEGRLSPTIRSKIESHLREKKFVESILPVTKWIVETAKFDIHKISNLNVIGKDYKNGQQKGYYNIKAYVLHRDGYKCNHCKKKNTKLIVHHIIFRSRGGTDSPDNLITLCKNCHEDLHKGKFTIKGSRSNTRHATHISIINSRLKKNFGKFIETFGCGTKYKRERILKLPKTHINDAVSICCLNKKEIELNNIYYLKKHVPHGDYRQTNGKQSEKRIPTKKLFGLRKFDLIKTPKGTGFVKGKRTRGFFIIFSLDGTVAGLSVNVKKECKRISARKTVLIEFLQ